VTVSRAFLDKVARAKDGLSHALPGATTEQVLEAALDLLLERQARAKSLVKRPRSARAGAATAIATSEPLAPAAPSTAEQDGSEGGVPAAIEREVRLRDGDRCQFPLDAGGVCGSTWQVQLDHLVPRALGGPTTAANLRCACSFHNRYAAEQELGATVSSVRRRK
jgi:5-methylcytosine-specific restriction endonuclease McrA